MQIYTTPKVNLEEIDRSILDQLGQGARVNFADQIYDRILIKSLSRWRSARRGILRPQTSNDAIRTF